MTAVRPLEQRLWSRVDLGAPDECWPWTGYRMKQGYGVIGTEGNKTALAHRVAFTLTNGPIPTDSCVCHSCDNPPCCNPRHLWLGDRVANAADRDAKGRGHDRRGTKNPAAKITPEIVTAIRAEYIPHVVGTPYLATKYGLSYGHVYRIVTGRSWR